jgi:hypothetical protein
MTYPTPEQLREIATEPMDQVPADEREGVRELYRAAADALEHQGFYMSPVMKLFLITEAKALEIETRGIVAADEENATPGWRVYFEGKVHVNADGTDLVPVMAMASTENNYATHRAAVIDAAHARPKRALSAEGIARAKAQLGAVRLSKRQEKELALTGGVTLTKEQKRQMQRTAPVFILPSYLGVATDRNGNVIGARS